MPTNPKEYMRDYMKKYRKKKDINQYMRNYHRRKRMKAAKEHGELTFLRGVTFPAQEYLENQMQEHKIAVATDSVARTTDNICKESASIKEQKYGFDEQQFEWCIEARMKAGENREDAQTYCRNAQVVEGESSVVFSQGTNVKQSIKALSSIVDRCQKIGIDENECMECILKRMDQGLNEEQARELCEKQLLKGDRSFVNEPARGSDSLSIKNREATPLERCISARMDVEGEDLETATKTCIKMLNDPMFRHIFTDGDAWKIGEALHDWSLEHDAKWAWCRENRDVERKAVDAEVERLRKESLKNQYSSDDELKPIAERNIAVKKERFQRQLRGENRDAEVFTVGDLSDSKVREKLIAEDNKGQRDYGKTHDQIVEEIKQQDAVAEEVKKAKRKAAEGSN